MANDIDPFAGEFVDNVFNSISTYAHTGADAIHSLVGTGNRDLGAIAGLTGNRLDLDYAVDDFGYFLLEESGDKVLARATEDDFYAAADLADVADGGSDALVDVVRLARYLFSAGENGFDIGKSHGCGATVVAMDDTGDQLIHKFHVLVVESITLCLADLLDHHLLGCLRADSLGNRFRSELVAIVRPIDLARISIDGYDNFLVFTIMLLGGRNERSLDAVEYDRLVNVLVTVNCVNNPQQFVGIHRFSLCQFI